ncbi:MAG: HDOD domain-containing protein [Terriglobales bacterium]
MANEKNNFPHLSISGRQKHPPVSAAPDAVGLLRTLLSRQTADLQAITQAIESDFGLTVQLFQLASELPATVPPGVFEISEIVVHLGLRQLRTMISHYPRNAALTS